MPEEAEIYGNCRFYVEFGGKVQGVFTEVSGLQVEVEVFEYEEGGTNDVSHRLPGRAKVSNLTLKRGMIRSNDFCNWCLDVAKGTIKRQNITVSMFETNREKAPIVTWVFENAYPIKWIGPQFVADGTAAAVETLELAHNGMTLGKG
jgi:phage tail-like protein